MPGLETRTVPAQVHGRYLLQAPAAPPRGLLVGFHGYGEAAEQHLEKLLQVPGAEHAAHSEADLPTIDVTASATSWAPG